MNVFGMTSNFYASPRYEALCKRAVGAGVDIFLANNRGMGVITRFTSTKKRSRYIGTAMEKFEDCIYDIDAAVKLLAKLGYKNIVLQGQSTGCQKIAYYCAKKQNRFIKGLVLLAPDDDHNLTKYLELKGKFPAAVRFAKGMVRRGQGNQLTPKWVSFYSAKRFLSYADPKNAEARIFNYDSNMREFGKITKPILVIFGSKEEFAVKPVREYMRILQSRTNSRAFSWRIINGAVHTFQGDEDMLAKTVLDWVRQLN